MMNEFYGPDDVGLRMCMYCGGSGVVDPEILDSCIFCLGEGFI